MPMTPAEPEEGDFIRPGIFVPKNLSPAGVLYYLAKILEYDRAHEPGRLPGQLEGDLRLG